jgi:hypothetical protein
VPSQAARHAGKEKTNAWTLRAKEAVMSSKVVNLMIGFVGLGAHLAIPSIKLIQHLHYVHCKGRRILKAGEIYIIGQFYNLPRSQTILFFKMNLS